MVRQETVKELRKAMYEDVNVLFEFYSDKYKEDSLEDAREYVTDITPEELEEYLEQDASFVQALITLATKAGNDETLLNRILDSNTEEAYKSVQDITGDSIPFDDFKNIVEHGGRPFFKSFEGASPDDDELGVGALDSVTGGVSERELHKIKHEIAKTSVEKIAHSLIHCFTAESEIDTPEGGRAIRDIQPGDIVYSLDGEGKKCSSRVTETTKGSAKVIEVHFSNGTVWNTTSSQFFYDGRRVHDVWQHRDRDIVTTDGTTKITAIVETGNEETVYDIIIDGNNIMFINGVAAEGYGN